MSKIADIVGSIRRDSINRCTWLQVCPGKRARTIAASVLPA